ncbi:MAG: ROK family protein [Oliverpabstia sp.]
MYLVIDIGGTFIKYAIMDEDSNFIQKDKIPTEKESLERFVDSIVGIYDKFADEYVIEGIAISSPGMIDSNTGFMYNGGSLFFINKINIVEILQNRCKVPVTVENDAKCAALAEVWKGSLADCQNSIALILGTAVGGAVIVDKKVLKGVHFMAGEFSYIFTDGKNYQDRSQLLAEQAGVPGLIRLVAKKKGISEEELNGEKIFSMVNQGDAEAVECLRTYCRGLAVQISNYQFLIDPEKIAIGGGISVQPILLELIREELRKLGDVFPYTMPIPEVTTCRFFNDSNLIGALYVHLKSKEERIDVEKVREFMRLVADRPEGQYLRELFVR